MLAVHCLATSKINTLSSMIESHALPIACSVPGKRSP